MENTQQIRHQSLNLSVTNEADAKDVANYFNSNLKNITAIVSAMRREVMSLDLTEECSSDFFAQRTHPLLECKDLTYYLVSQIQILRQDIESIIDKGVI